MAIVIWLLGFCFAIYMMSCMLEEFVKLLSNSKKTKEMNAIVLFILLCALGALCYWFYFKCVDWFEKI